MKDKKILSCTDRTSWSRIWMVGKFYMPVIGKKLILFPIISLIVGSMMVLGEGFLPIEAYKSLVMSCSVFIMYLTIFGASMPLAKMKAIEIETMLPALNFEKCLFTLIYALIIIPIIVYLPCNIIWWIFNGFQSPINILMKFSPESIDIYHGNISYMLLTFFVVIISFIASGLWGTMAAKRHRMWWCFAAVMLTFGGYILICFLIGVIVGIYMSLNDLAFNSSILMHTFIKYLICILSIYAIFALWKVCRCISRRQI